MQSRRKKLSRKVFDEKLIHRFFLETLYFGSLADKKKLLPSGIKANDVRLIVPEANSLNREVGSKDRKNRSKRRPNYRPDFIIHLADNRQVPVEIKWNTQDLKALHQIHGLEKGKGFLVVFEGDLSSFGYPKIDVIKINYNSFIAWLSSRISTLLKDTISTHSGHFESSNPRHWIVALRGSTSIFNFLKMIQMRKQGKAWWAFEADSEGTVIRNLLDLVKGDQILFLFFKSPGDGNAMKIHLKSRKLKIAAFAQCTISEPYYLCLSGPQAEFFESANNRKSSRNIADRQWIHFTDFSVDDFRCSKTNCKHLGSSNQDPDRIKTIRAEIQELIDSVKAKSLGGEGEIEICGEALNAAIAQSDNKNGSPRRISGDEWSQLLHILRFDEH